MLGDLLREIGDLRLEGVSPPAARGIHNRVHDRLTRVSAARHAQYCASQPSTLQFLDVATPLLGPDQTLRPELYQKDGLHLSPVGYAIWNNLLRPHLEK